jgi:hypothetical protein
MGFVMKMVEGIQVVVGTKVFFSINERSMLPSSMLNVLKVITGWVGDNSEVPEVNLGDRYSS